MSKAPGSFTIFQAAGVLLSLSQRDQSRPSVAIRQGATVNYHIYMAMVGELLRPWDLFTRKNRRMSVLVVAPLVSGDMRPGMLIVSWEPWSERHQVANPIFILAQACIS